MAQKPISMNQIRRIIQLLSAGTKLREITKQCQHSRNTVRHYKRRIEQSKLTWEELLLMSDEQLGAIIYDPPETGKERKSRFDALNELLPQCREELKKTGVTRKIIWQEYRMLHADGYGYTMFCDYLSRFLGSKETVMHFLHRKAEKLMVDFAGKTMSYVNEDGEIIPCQVFVAVLPFSGYSYVEAVHSQQQEDFVRCLENTLAFMGGSPQSILSDNLKSSVKRSSRYEPEFTDLMQQFSVHYNTTVMATRIVKPRDKASVEKAVHLAYERVYAPLRNTAFRSLKELNHAIKEQLHEHHARPFRDGEQTRAQLFEQERLDLLPLPQSTLEIKQRVKAKVQKNYHVLIGQDWHYYSVPYNHVGKQVQIIYTHTAVEVYQGHERIAMHMRNKKRNGYTTHREHMPPHHQHYTVMKGWDADYFKNQAAKKSPEVLSVVEQILQSRQFYEQAYNACLGILRLGNKYGDERLQSACILALKARAVNYRFINNILINNTDLRSGQTGLFSLPVDHQNLRGASEYT